MTIRLVLAEDHSLVRQALTEVFNDTPGLSVVATVGHADEILDRAVAHTPHVLLMDIDMPGRDVFEVIPEVHAALPTCRVVVLSAHMQDRHIDRALRNGAAGYLLKGEPTEGVIDAIRRVASGGTAFSAPVADRLIAADKQGRSPSPGITRASLLSPREREVLALIAQGWSKKEVAESIKVSVKTVEKHAGSVMRKLDLHNRVELARYAIREGLIEP